MKTIFTGTNSFAAPSLEALIASAHEVVAVVTQPDKPKGRGKQMQMSPVKEIALAHGLPVLHPEKISAPESVAEIQSHGPVDVMVVVAYGQKIPRVILEWPKRGVVNVHGSILPKYRGAAPIQYALIMGEQQTGVTTMLMDEGWDTGDILLQRSIDIVGNENSGELSQRLARLGGDLLVETLNGLAEGTIVPMPQDDDLASMAPSLKRDFGVIDWTNSAPGIVNLVRGVTPRPGAFTRIDGTQVKVWSAVVQDREGQQGEPGQVLGVEKDGVVVAAGSGSVRLVEVQPESRKQMAAVDFARGAKITPGSHFDVRYELP